MHAVSWTGRAGKVPYRELWLLLARLRAQGIDVSCEEITRGRLTVDFQVNFSGTPEQEACVDAVLDALVTWSHG